jgi:hypothetical protein
LTAKKTATTTTDVRCIGRNTGNVDPKFTNSTLEREAAIDPVHPFYVVATTIGVTIGISLWRLSLADTVASDWLIGS